MLTLQQLGNQAMVDSVADSIDYGNLMHSAMRGLIKQVLLDVRAEGLPGDHHFFITFDTTHPDVRLAVWLAERYPTEMTVVMQHWYDDLEVTDDGFAVTLNFGDAPEPLYVPFDAIRTFVDPSVEFGLRFEQSDSSNSERMLTSVDSSQSDTAPQTDDDPSAEPDAGADTPKAAPKDAQIVSLDSFRK